MEESIKNFAKQFNFKPEVENSDSLEKFEKTVVCGMGGSHMGADILKLVAPEKQILVHNNYGLPLLPDTGNTLFIASSYSGNTEETLDFAESVLKQNLPLAIVATGGKLLEFAKENNLPFVMMPATHIQPRVSLGFLVLALAKIIGADKLLSLIQEIGRKLNPISLKEEGMKLAEQLFDTIPIIYSSERNGALGNIWKIKINETAKNPAFFNVFPELNHNEMTGFDIMKLTDSKMSVPDEEARDINLMFHLILIKDSEDDVRIQKRMDITGGILKEKGLGVIEVKMEDTDRIAKIFNNILLADWTALALAEYYKHDPENVPMVEEFKKQLKVIS